MTIPMGIVVHNEGLSRLQDAAGHALAGFQASTNQVLFQVIGDDEFELFPRLKERVEQMGGTLSGGEQQMLAVGRALMAKPRLLLMDEPSMGLAPILVEEIFNIIEEINKQGVTILLVEQNAHMAFSVSNRGYVLETGAIHLEGPSQELEQNPQVRAAYLGGD